MIGSGIFTVTGTATAGKIQKVESLLHATVLDLVTHGGHAASTMGRPGAGPAITISFLLVMLACIVAGLCYAELASMIPVAGSSYTYAYAILGELFAWIIGWDLILEYAVANMSVGGGFFGVSAGSLRQHIRIPSTAIDRISHVSRARFARRNLQRSSVADYTRDHVVLVKGVRESTKTNTVMVLYQDRRDPDILHWSRTGD